MQKHQQLATLTSPCPATHQEAQVKRNSALEWIAMCTRETRGITTCLIFNARYLSTQHVTGLPFGCIVSLAFKVEFRFEKSSKSHQLPSFGPNSAALVPWKSQTSACRRTLELPRCPAAPRSSEHPPAKVSRPTRRHSASGSGRRSP